jgi:outer membrane protein
MALKVLKLTPIVFIIFTGLAVTDHLFAEEYSLEDLYKIALERSERIKISEEDLYISERSKDKALSALLPTLSAFGGYTKYSEEKRSAGSLIQPSDATSWGVRLDQSFSLGGREVVAFGISKENIEKAKYDLYAVKEGYLFSVAFAYYGGRCPFLLLK